MTFDSEGIIEEMLRHDGIYYDDPRMDSIWQYQSMTGKVCYAAFARPQDCDMLESHFTHAPVLLFDVKQGGLTTDGANWLAKRNEDRLGKAITETLE